jgi:hypothetical protein
VRLVQLKTADLPALQGRRGMTGSGDFLQLHLLVSPCTPSVAGDLLPFQCSRFVMFVTLQPRPDAF